MRILLTLLAMLALTQCATAPDRFAVGRSEQAFVIIGLAEAYDATESRYDMLWRKLAPGADAFTDYDDARSFQAETNSDDTLRIDGVPGEFTLVEIPPGAYALDSVFGRIRDGRVDYIAQGVVAGPERPMFEVRAGEAVYLGIWQASLDNSSVVARPWRLSEDDLSEVVRAARNPRGAVTLRETSMRAIACAPHRISDYSQRQIC
jgi:hypothetical protein